MTNRLFTSLRWLFFFIPSLAIAFSPLTAQPGPSFSFNYEYFPYAALENPDTTPVNGARNFEQDLEIQVGVFHAEFSAPIIFGKGATVIVHTLSYDRLELRYRNWDNEQGGNRIEEAHGLEYTFTLVHQLSDTWNITAVATPGLHSDFKGTLSADDFSASSAVIFSRQHSEDLSYGFGAAYAFNFGQAYPIPLLALNWAPGSKTRLDLLLPAHAEFWYLPSTTFEMGLIARVSGNQYHGDPDIFAVDNPQMQYSSGTFGPSVKVHFSERIHLNVDAGYTVLRRFDFSDGSNELQSLDLENSGFVRAGLTIGG
jgi:hypothetical protein